MLRLMVVILGLTIAFTAVGAGLTRAGVPNHTEQPAAVIAMQADPSEPTIEALETRVAELEATLAANRPTPTSTPAPRPTLDTEPMQLTSDTELLYYYVVPNSQNEAAIFGEVRNISEVAVASPYVKFTLFDAEGNIVDTVTARPLFSYVGPGETVPVEASYTGLPMGEWATEEIVGCGNVSTDPLPEGLSVEDVNEVRKTATALEIEGKVRNGSSEPIDRVAVRAILFRPDGRFGGFGSALINSAIPPGKTARFTLSAYGSNMAGIIDAGGTYTYTVIPGINSTAAYGC